MKNHMESRKLSKGSLEYFPTPPWATRAVIGELLFPLGFELKTKRVREPCAGGGHMVLPLREQFGAVDVADVANWGINPEIRDFLLESFTGRHNRRMGRKCRQDCRMDRNALVVFHTSKRPWRCSSGRPCF